MLILEKDTENVERMHNKHTNDKRDKMLVYKGMHIEGPVTVTAEIVSLGYHEKIICTSIEAANKVFTEIAEVL